MNWELYEVWAVDVDGHETLIETTKSLKEARQLAEVNLDEDNVECVIYKEDELGDLVEVERLDQGLQLSWLEQRTHNPLVPGSSPGGPTIQRPLIFWLTAFCFGCIIKTRQQRNSMTYTLITSKGTVMQFYIKAVADLYQSINGGVVITQQILVDDFAQTVYN